jgi:hypothetical protein
MRLLSTQTRIGFADEFFVAWRWDLRWSKFSLWWQTKTLGLCLQIIIKNIVNWFHVFKSLEMMFSKSFNQNYFWPRVGEFLFSVILNERQNMKDDNDQKHLLLKNLRILNQSKMTKYLPPGKKKNIFWSKRSVFSN